MSINKVILVGNLGADPELRDAGGTKVASMSLATSESYTDRSGERVTRTEWHRLEAWGNLASVAERFLKKGSKIYVEGQIRTNQWQDDQGQTRYQTRIRVQVIDMLDKRENSDGVERPQPKDESTPTPPQNTSVPEDDDLPF